MQPCVRDGASRGSLGAVTTGSYGAPTPLWDAVDNPQVANRAVTRGDARLSTIHRPYDDDDKSMQTREITE